MAGGHSALVCHPMVIHKAATNGCVICQLGRAPYIRHCAAHKVTWLLQLPHITHHLQQQCTAWAACM